MAQSHSAAANRTAQHIQIAEKYGAHNYHPLPVVIERAEASGCGTSMATGTSTCLSATRR